MSTFNQPLFNQPEAISRPQQSFPELYIRNFLNDLGEIPLELTPLTFLIETFTVVANQTDFNLSHNPTALFSPVVYLNGTPLYKDKDYTINSSLISIPLASLNVGDILTVRYVY